MGMGVWVCGCVGVWVCVRKVECVLSVRRTYWVDVCKIGLDMNLYVCELERMPPKNS